MSLRVLFVPDSGAAIGGGHVMRCLTLAAALQHRGARCSLLAQEAGRGLAATFGPSGLEVIAPGEDSLDGIGQAFAGLGARFDVVVVDNYRLGAEEEGWLGAGGARVAVIDDLADRPHRCGLLVDPGFERRPGDYGGLVRDGTVLLTGVAYAPVRPAFALLREEARRRRDGRPVARALVSLGLTDLGGITGRVTDMLLPMLGEVELDVVLGARAPSLDRLRALAAADRRIRLHVDVQDMERLMLAADVAIGAGGSSTWERACLGLPALSLILAVNQREQAHRLAACGVTLAAEAGAKDFAAALAKAWSGLVGDAQLRLGLSRSGMELCDGLGAERVAYAILALGGQPPESLEGS